MKKNTSIQTSARLSSGSRNRDSQKKTLVSFLISTLNFTVRTLILILNSHPQTLKNLRNLDWNSVDFSGKFSNILVQFWCFNNKDFNTEGLFIWVPKYHFVPKVLARCQKSLPKVSAQNAISACRCIDPTCHLVQQIFPSPQVTSN